MAYAVADDVIDRAGRLAAAWPATGGTPGTVTAFDSFLDSCAAEIDAEIMARGFDPSALSQEAIAALVDLNAYGALARALVALVPGSRGGNAADLLAYAQKVWEDGMASIKDGTHPLIALLLSGQGGTGNGVSAGSLWSEEPNYGSIAELREEELALYNTNLQVEFRRRMSF
jgi:hypothetical protein